MQQKWLLDRPAYHHALGQMKQRTKVVAVDANGDAAGAKMGRSRTSADVQDQRNAAHERFLCNLLEVFKGEGINAAKCLAMVHTVEMPSVPCQSYSQSRVADNTHPMARHTTNGQAHNQWPRLLARLTAAEKRGPSLPQDSAVCRDLGPRSRKFHVDRPAHPSEAFGVGG